MTSDCVETPGVKKASWLSVTGCPKSTLFSGVGTGSIMQPVKVKHALSRATKLQLVILHVKLCMQMILADLKGCASFGMWSFVKSPELVESIICGLLNREDIMAALPQPLRSTVPKVLFLLHRRIPGAQTPDRSHVWQQRRDLKDGGEDDGQDRNGTGHTKAAPKGVAHVLVMTGRGKMI